LPSEEEGLKCSHSGSSSPTTLTENTGEKGIAPGLRE
jgi:hypothetical protein